MPSKATIVAAVLIGLLILLVWTVLLSTLSTLGDSDAAGNGMAEAFAGFEIILLWVSLATFLLLCVISGAMPWPSGIALLILLPASGLAAFSALQLLSDRTAPPFLWPIVTPAMVPPVMVIFGFWALLPPLRNAVAGWIASVLALGAILLLCIAIWPLMHVRDRANQQAEQERAGWAADFARLAPDAPLWQWTQFLNTRDETRVDAILQQIGKLERRQADAELMLDRGDFPLHYLASMHLDPTQAICDKTRGLLRRQVPPLALQVANSKPYTEIADQVAVALSAMNWLSSHGCPCTAEARAWATMASGYRDTNFDVYELKELSE